jgi:hypothetical protein
MSVFQLDAKCSIGEIFQNLPLHLDRIFLRHIPVSALSRKNSATLKVGLLQQTLVLM